MATKKLINSVETCVDDSIKGFVTIHPGLRQLAGQPRVILRADIEEYKQQGKVTTVTGGGSGHEPCFMGYIGEGMMCGAVHGALFASPGPSSILATLRALGRNHPAGVIVVINNYTGDRLNFGMAVERARSEGIRVEVVVNADDCAVTSVDKSAGRRGLSALILIMKIIGHLAESGERIEQIVAVATAAAKNVATMGVCLSPCSLPGGGPLFHLGAREMELGMGMHGEAGMKRVHLQPAKDVVEQVISHMTSYNNPSRVHINKGDHIALLINNMGSTSDLEMNILACDAVLYLEKHQEVLVDRVYVSKFVASMEMAGFSFTLMLLDGQRELCFDAPTTAVSWLRPLLPQGCSVRITPNALAIDTSKIEVGELQEEHGATFTEVGAEVFRKAVSMACVELIANKQRLNELDREVGDSDCGSTLANGAKAILHELKTTLQLSTVPCHMLMVLAEAVEQSMGGCSGALYSLLLTAVSQQLSTETELTSLGWVRALKRGIDTICRYGGAEPGDRTMVDPLYAAWQVAVQHSSSCCSADISTFWKPVVEAAVAAAEETAKMKARAGRASNVNADLLKRPDAGATACAIWMSAVLNVCANTTGVSN